MSSTHLFRNIFVGLSLVSTAPCILAQGPQTGSVAETKVYYGGDILTMRGTSPEYVESLAVKDGKILFVGSRTEAQKLAGQDAKLIDLGGKTLLPGFIDTHGHFVYFGKNLVDANLFNCADIPELIARMKKQVDQTPQGAWIVGFGYQARAMKEGRPPTSEELDQISKDRPVMVVDSSGHLGAANSAAFKAAGITSDTPDPTGGAFTRGKDGKSLLGPMEETALNAVRSKRPPFSGELASRAITGAAKVWASYGQTTAMEAGLGLGNDDIAIVTNAIDNKLLPIDLYIAAKDSTLDDTLAAAYTVASEYRPDASGIVEKLRAARPDLDTRYINRVRMGGVKFWLDGSLDTAWFTQPYTETPAGKTAPFSGYRQIPDEVLDAAFDKYWPTELQIHMHMNGDAAADQALKAITKAVKKHGMRDHRPVFVHATWLRVDQIDQIKRYGAIPSFLTAGIIPGGDAVVRLWGAERSAGAMASRTFLRSDLPFTFSHDAPVSPTPSILDLVDAGVNRLSGSGKVVGPDERIPPYHALRAVTAMAAYQLKEEKTKGTLEAGKLADLVVLDKNPLKVESTTIKGIAVLETIKEGKTVFTK
ncbi:MAG: amidohydrolase family protein [Planctomycetaceae bacterium]|nr:amidohydrolase family protein [Planctomycetaceae bacterium]